MKISEKTFTRIILILLFVIAPLTGILISMFENGDIIIGYMFLATIFVMPIFLVVLIIVGVMGLLNKF